jgi:hypothetical protein
MTTIILILLIGIESMVYAIATAEEMPWHD